MAKRYANIFAPGSDDPLTPPDGLRVRIVYGGQRLFWLQIVKPRPGWWRPDRVLASALVDPHDEVDKGEWTHEEALFNAYLAAMRSFHQAVAGNEFDAYLRRLSS